MDARGPVLRDGTIRHMRIRGPNLLLLLLTSFPLPSAAANACMSAPRIPGSRIDAPHAVFEAYVVESGARRALVEVVRSYHGPYGPGQTVETITIEDTSPCMDVVAPGAHVLVGSESGGPFEIVAVLPNIEVLEEVPFAALAFTDDEPRRSLRPTLKNVSLRGEVDGGLAAQLYARARPDRRAHCEISRAGSYAQVSWGEAFGGNDARHKVIFERVDRGWVEILRYQAPEPAPARHRARRAKQRALWAGNDFHQPAPGRRIGRFEVVIPPLST
jgi:hypothetical protein